MKETAEVWKVRRVRNPPLSLPARDCPDPELITAFVRLTFRQLCLTQIFLLGPFGRAQERRRDPQRSPSAPSCHAAVRWLCYSCLWDRTPLPRDLEWLRLRWEWGCLDPCGGSRSSLGRSVVVSAIGASTSETSERDPRSPEGVAGESW